MNIDAQSVMKNLNVLSLEVTNPYPALSAMMNVLNGLCPLAVLRAVANIHHRPDRRHVQAAQAKIVVLVIETTSTPFFPSPRMGRAGWGG